MNPNRGRQVWNKEAWASIFPMTAFAKSIDISEIRPNSAFPHISNMDECALGTCLQIGIRSLSALQPFTVKQYVAI